MLDIVTLGDASALANTSILADAGTAISIAISLVLLVALVVLFTRVQALSAEIAELRREARKPAPATPPSPVVAAAPVPVPAMAVAPTPAPVAVKPVEPVPTGASGQELIAIITAAAMAVLGRNIAVRRITFINQNTVSGWAEAGRLSIHTSHNVRRN